MSSKTYPNLSLEQSLFDAGTEIVIGIDEVGRGSLFGPVAVGIAVLSRDRHSGTNDWPARLADSKLISQSIRESLFEPVSDWVEAHSVGMASAAEIDRDGIVASLALAARRAIETLPSEVRARVAGNPDAAFAILDGSHNWLGSALGPVRSMVQTKADRDCVSVAAASVLAKVERDNLMISIAAADPRVEPYGIAGNKGYSSATHLDALRRLGPLELHRKTWLGKILGDSSLF